MLTRARDLRRLTFAQCETRAQNETEMKRGTRSSRKNRHRGRSARAGKKPPRAHLPVAHESRKTAETSRKLFHAITTITCVRLLSITENGLADYANYTCYNLAFLRRVKNGALSSKSWLQQASFNTFSSTIEGGDFEKKQ